MDVECYPMSEVPGTSALFRDFTERPADSAAGLALRRWYPADPFSMAWARQSPTLEIASRGKLADTLAKQVRESGGGPLALAHVEKLRAGAAAVVTGQQVALFGGPLLTLLKAATAVRKARDASRVSGREHVPVFWLASEDHDLAEVDQVSLAAKTEVETLRLGLRVERPVAVGGVSVLGPEGEAGEGRAILAATLDRASELLGWAPVCDLLRDCYAPPSGGHRSLAGAFARLLTRLFEPEGLIVMDASGRDLHALGAIALRAAIEQAEVLETALLARSEELVAAGYHAQVLVVPGHSLLFLLDADTGARQALRRLGGDIWKAGTRSYTSAELLAILEAEPERLSPNALLRPVFQDAILPTAAYIGGPAEIAYFAQCAAIYERVLGRVTPVLPRLSATLIEPGIGKLMAQHELGIQAVWQARTAEALALRLGARCMPIEGKRKLAAAGNAMDAELDALTACMTAMSADLGRAAGVSASKMRYQMNRLRRMAAGFELQKSASLEKGARAIALELLPNAHLQERVLGMAWALARFGEGLPALLVENAGQECPGHRVIFL